jgi:hypothetical protein
MKLKLDLHDIYNRGQDIDRALQAIIDEAEAKKASSRSACCGFLSKKRSKRNTTG